MSNFKLLVLVSGSTDYHKTCNVYEQDLALPCSKFGAIPLPVASMGPHKPPNGQFLSSDPSADFRPQRMNGSGAHGFVTDSECPQSGLSNEYSLVKI